jgi:hypothetical protein
MYRPDYTFSFKAGALTSSNPLAQYWHVFDLVNIGSTWKVSTSTTGQDGVLRTDWQSVLADYHSR